VSVLISAIIPTYNRSKLLPRALDSIFAQTRPVDEVIVVDDGSTDDTADMMAGYVARGVRYVRKENGGASSARNHGLELARGTLIAFLDSDDEWRPEKTARQLGMMDDQPEAGLCFCDSAWACDGEVRNLRMNWDGSHDAFGQRLGIRQGWSGYIPAHQFRRGQIWTSLVGMNQVIVRAEVFRQCGGFDSRFDPAEDYEMWLRVSRRYGVCYLDEPLAVIHSHSESLTRQPQLAGRFRRNTLRAYQSELAGEEHPELAGMLRERIRLWWEDEILRALAEGPVQRVIQTCTEARQQGWRADGHTFKVIRLACTMPRLAMLLRRMR